MSRKKMKYTDKITESNFRRHSLKSRFRSVGHVLFGILVAAALLFVIGRLVLNRSLLGALRTSTIGQWDNGDIADDDENGGPEKTEEKEFPKRANSIAELEEKLAKIKDQHGFNIKKKLAKKSLSSKLNKKMKKELKKRAKGPKEHVKELKEMKEQKDIKENKADVSNKPVFNTSGKLVFSKFDFSSISHKNEKLEKREKDPKKVLENLKLQEQKIKDLESSDTQKAKEVKEKIAWKNILQKAEGEKIKDDPILLKKTIKKEEQKKKKSGKLWEQRVEKVVQKKEERQKKRRENISKKKKEKKSKVVKAAVKRGRVVI